MKLTFDRRILNVSHLSVYPDFDILSASLKSEFFAGPSVPSVPRWKEEVSADVCAHGHVFSGRHACRGQEADERRTLIVVPISFDPPFCISERLETDQIDELRDAKLRRSA
jgi:hypothetical protein